MRENIPFASFSAVIEPGEGYEHTAYFETTEISQSGDSKISIRIKYYDAEGNYKQFGAGKVIYIKKALTQSTIQLNSPNALPRGEP